MFRRVARAEAKIAGNNGGIHTTLFYIVGLDERGALDLLSGLTGPRPYSVRRFRALIVQVACDLGAFRRQMKLCIDACDCCRCQELAIGV
jgi:hypothetical protein